MRRRVSIILGHLTLALGAELAAQAPGWDATFVVDPFPPAYLSDWETNPTIASLTVTNGTAADGFVTIYFSVADGSGGIILQGQSDPQLVPAGTSAMFSSASTFDGTSSYDTSIEDVIVRTGRFPQDDYTACVTVTDETGLVIADNLCGFFSTIAPDPPYLLFPSDGDTITTPDPIFEWTPLQVPVTIQTRYVVQVAEILQGQTPYEALTSRILHYEDLGQFMPALQYPVGAQPFQQGRQYAWWVQAIDFDGYPLSSNEGRSEVWTFTYLADDGGEPAGEEIGGGAELIPISSGATGADIVDLGTASYATVRDQLAGSSGGNRIRLPLPDVDFVPLELWNVRLDSDDAQRALAIRATASLPHTSVDVLLVGSWDDAGVGTFSLGLDPAAFSLSDWVGGTSGTELADLDFDGAILTLASAAGTLDVAALPPMVGEFYGAPAVPLVAGVSVRHVVDPRGTAFGDWLASFGVVASRIEISGDLGIDASALFDDAAAVPAPSLDLGVAVDVDEWGDAPEWLTIGTVTLAVTNDPALAFSLDVEASADIAEETLAFVLSADVTTADGSSPLVLTGRALTAWEQPFGIEWLVVDSTRLVLAAGSAVLESWVTAGTEQIALEASIEGTGDTLEGVLAATVAELNVGDLLGLIQAQTGRADLGSQIPGNVASLTDVRFELRSGDPPTFTVSATATALGQSTDFMYTMIPPDLPGLDFGGEAAASGTDTGSGGGLFAIRLADWSLGNLLPSLQGSPFGDLSFPQVSFVMPTWDWGSDTPTTPTDTTSSSSSWSIPWPSMSPLARDFLLPSWPCVLCGAGTGGGGGPGLPSLPDLGSFTLSGGLNFSAPISFADLSAAFSGLFEGLGGGGGGGSDVVFQGMPGISLAGLFSGNLDLTSLLDISADIDLSALSALENMPEWLTLGTTSIEVSNDPAVAVMLEVEATAAIAEETLDFALRADITNADGSAPLVLTGRALTPWEQPFGIEWLVVDSTRLVLTPPIGDETVASAVLESWVTAGTEQIALEASIEGTGETLEGVLAATVAELNVGDLLALIQAQTGRTDLGSQIPPDVASLTDVRFELRSGDPPTFTVSATATALGQSTEFLYTMVPPDLPGLDFSNVGGGGGAAGATDTESGGGLFAIRLADWSLGNLLPSIRGTPFGDLSFPQVSFVMPTWDWGGSSGNSPTPTDTTSNGGGGTWSIPWPSLSPLARDFMLPSWPCVTCALGGGGTGGGGVGLPSLPDLGSFTLRGGLNFSAPISFADLSSAFSGLFENFGGGGGGGGSDVVFQGMPGISLAGLFSGNLDLTSLLDISAEIDLSALNALENMPEWLTLGTTSIEVSNDPAVAVMLGVEATAEIGAETLEFALRADLSTATADAPLVLTGRALTPWEQPFGIEWLVVDSTRLVLTAPRGETVAGSAVLESWVTAGSELIALEASIEGTGETLEGVLSATITELNVGDLLALIQAQTGRTDLGSQIPPDVASLTDVRFELRSGDPPTFTVSATATALGLSTELMYTMVPPDLPGLDFADGGGGGAGDTQSGGGLFAIRLPDWSLSSLLPSISGTPFGDLRFPQVSFVMPTWDWGGSTPAEPTPTDTTSSSGGSWSIPWGSFSPLARDFMLPSWPCVTCAFSGGGGTGGGGTGLPDLGSLSLSGGLNFSAPISFAELSAAFSGLFGSFGGGGGGGGSVVLQGMPGISFAGLLSGNFDLTSLLDIRGILPPITEAPFGWPDWIRPTSQSLRITSQPAVNVEASIVLEADLDGVKVFDLSAQATNAGGAGAELEGFMRGRWEQPFGLEWLALDSVHVALAAGSVGPRVALGAGFEIGSTTAGVDIDVRGTSENRSLDFRALARNLSTADVATFLNDAFDAGLAVPTSPITLDSLTIAFSSGDATSFDVVGAFSAGMDATDALAALADLLPGASAPTQPPFSLGTLAGAWFELHIVPDSVWGGYGGGVQLGDAGGPGFGGQAEIRLGASRTGAGDDWIVLDVQLAASNLSAADAVAALEDALPSGWEIPEAFAAASGVTLESASMRVGLDTRADSANVELAGSGRYVDGSASFAASALLRMFDVADTTWADGALSVALADVSVTEGIQQAASLLGGDWALPENLSALAPIQLDTAALTVGFDSRADSLSARVSGAGSMGSGAMTVLTDFSLVQLPALTWAVGLLDVDIREVALPDALTQVAAILPGNWTLPPSVSGLSPIVLDSATLRLAFDTRDAAFSAAMQGASHMGEVGTRLEGTTDLRLASTADGQAVEGRVTLAVADLDLNGLLAQTAELLPGDWTLPEGFGGFDALALDSAMLDVGFSTVTDSLGASVRGLGRLADGTTDVAASAALELALVGDVSGTRGAVELVASDLTTTAALERIAALLPGDWELPDGLEAFDAIALDSAGFVLGFDTWADSVFAGVAGTGTWGNLEADARLDFASLPAGNRAAGLISMSLGPVGAGEAIESIAELLPGEWELPDGFTSFDALQLDGAALTAGFDTQGDSLFASFEGSGSLENRTAIGRLGFAQVGEEVYGSGRVTLGLGDVTLDQAFAEVASMLPGDWPTPTVDFDLGTLSDVVLEVGFDTRADSIWAGVEAGATMAQRDGVATLYVVSVGGAGGTSESWVEGTFTVDIGDVGLTDALDLAVSLVPSAPAVPQLDFDLGGLTDAVLEAGFRVGAADSAWAGLSGRFDFGGLTGDADIGLALGGDQPSGYLNAAFDNSFTVPDVVSLLTGFVPGLGSIELPPLGPLDIGLDEPLLSFNFGERTGISLGGTSSLFGKDADALFSMMSIGGRPQLLFGVQVPDLSFTDLLPDFSNPLTDALSLDLAALTLTRGEGRVNDEDMSPTERSFFSPLAGGLPDFSMDFRPGLNLTGLLPLASGAMKDMVDMLSPGASNLTLQGTLPLPGFGGLRDMSISAALPPMAPPGRPAWFVEGQIAFQMTGRPSVGLAGELTIDVEGDTLTFDIESNVAIVPAGVELSIAGGLTAANPWVGPLGIEWLTLNEIRLALGLSPIAVRLGFLADAAIADKNLRVALGTKINIYTGVPIGVIVLAEAPDGLSLAELSAFHRQVAGPNAAALPTDALPDMAVRDLGVKVATYTDLDLDVTAGIGLSGALFLATGPGGALEEFGSLDLSVDVNGILANGRLSAFSVGPVSFDEALIDLALTLQEQHLILSGGATIADLLSADIALAMTRDSLRFETDFYLFDLFRTYMLVRAGFDVTNPTFQIHAALYPEFSDQVMLDAIDALLPVGQASLTVANGALTAATTTLDGAENTLDNAIWLASEASRIAMDAAYAAYQLAVREYNRASNNYSYYSSRCTWYRPGDCAAASYWAGVRTYWRGQKAITYPIYTAARTVYLNQSWLSSSAPVQAAYDAVAAARATFQAAQAEVQRMQIALNQMQAFVDSVQSCATCPRPPMPFSLISAEFDAALDGFFGQSGVQLDVLYQIYGQQQGFAAGFSGSISDLAINLVTAATDAIF